MKIIRDCSESNGYPILSTIFVHKIKEQSVPRSHILSYWFSVVINAIKIINSL